MTRNVSTGCIVYGDISGAVAFLDLPDGVIPPPKIAHMTYLGTPYDLITDLVNYLHAQHKTAGRRRPRPQQALADMLGTTQQEISRWMNAQCAPRISDERWAKIVQLYAQMVIPAGMNAAPSSPGGVS